MEGERALAARHGQVVAELETVTTAKAAALATQLAEAQAELAEAHVQISAASVLQSEPPPGFGPAGIVSRAQEILSIQNIPWAPDDMLGRPNRARRSEIREQLRDAQLGDSRWSPKSAGPRSPASPESALRREASVEFRTLSATADASQDPSSGSEAAETVLALEHEMAKLKDDLDFLRGATDGSDGSIHASALGRSTSCPA